jgi:multiple RNA-binding domain-containing protein 1
VGTTLYVKNLSFSSTEETLRKVMAQGGKVKAVKIMTKPDAKKGGGAKLSMGYGFVEFATGKEAA